MCAEGVCVGKVGGRAKHDDDAKSLLQQQTYAWLSKSPPPSLTESHRVLTDFPSVGG